MSISLCYGLRGAATVCLPPYAVGHAGDEALLDLRGGVTRALGGHLGGANQPRPRSLGGLG